MKGGTTRGVGFWASSALPPGLSALGYLLEQTLSSALPGWWLSIPWLNLFLFGSAVWIGYALYDLTDSDSRLRTWWTERFGLAKVEFIFNRPADTGDTQTITARVRINRRTRNLGCYIRWASPTMMFIGNHRWDWSPQTTHCEGINAAAGKVLDIPLVSIARRGEGPERGVRLGTEQIGIDDSPFEQVRRVELVIADEHGRTTVRRLIAFMKSSKPTFYNLNEAFFDGFVET